MATKQKKVAKSTPNPTNLMAVCAVVGLVLFGLGYVVGKTKAYVYAEKTCTARMGTLKQDLFKDQNYRYSFMDSMMNDETSRTDLFRRVDEYKANLKNQMMYRK